MSNTCRMAVALACVICFTPLAEAQRTKSSRRTHIPTRKVASEAKARAAWRPTRPSEFVDHDAAAPLESAEISNASSRVQLVDHLEDPMRLVEPEAAILPAPPSQAVLDGQIAVEPAATVQHETLMPPGAPIDGLPVYPAGSAMACDDGCCDLGCDSACDGMACDGCSMCGEFCSPQAWRPCMTFCLPQDGWFSAEYLLWWQDGMRLPPLVTTSPTGTAQANSGVLGQSGTSVLFGGGDVLDDSFDGGRLRFGVWLDRCHTWGVGGEYFRIGSESDSFSRTSSGDPLLSRPFFNTQADADASQLVAFPGVVSGTVSAVATSELTGASFYFRHLRCCDEGCGRSLFCNTCDEYCTRTELLFGYRFMELEESVTIREDLVSEVTADPGSFDIFDQFDTRNQFNGFDIGWNYRRVRGLWTLDALVRMAIGNNRQTVTINGATTINDPSQTPTQQTFEGGLLAQSSNIGRYTQNELAFIPEFGLTAGYQLTERLRATIGYTFIYWSNVVRPGEQIDLDVNPNLLPPQNATIVGSQRPTFAFDTTDYWAQGLSFGGEYRW